MSPELLKLHISQLSKTIERSKTNRYSDSRKQDYHNNLVLLLKLIKEQDLDNLSYIKLVEFKKIIDFIFLSFEFLDNSILTIIPHEIVYCLEKALNDWDATSKYIIVTTLNNDILGYYFNPKLSLIRTDHDLIKANFNIEFPFKFIQISLPKYLVHDYLANVVLYHELGHFVDLKYKISESIVRLEHSYGRITDSDFHKEYSHYSEYFADVFAAQYIGNSSSNYLNYIAHKNQDAHTHPSTDKRIEIVREFLSGNLHNRYLTNLIEATKAITNIELIQRFSLIETNEIKEFIPPLFKDDKELHSIFKIGWDLWLTEIESYKTKGIQYEEKYRILNNLIEKSISIHMILENWKK